MTCSLADCERLIGNWQTVGNCLGEGMNKSCGPGLSQQNRVCINGTIQKCMDIRLTRSVSCEIAENPLPDCDVILDEWKNITNCVANATDKSCGPGTVVLNRDCTDGTIDLCSDIETVRNVSCQDFNMTLPDCEGKLLSPYVFRKDNMI